MILSLWIIPRLGVLADFSRVTNSLDEPEYHIVETLRSELIESQKVRSDLLKWKLLIVSGVGGAALGFSGVAPANAHLALAVLPLACAYVDLLCRHLSLRNKAIGVFVEKSTTHTFAHLREYESFYSDLSKNAWKNNSLESIALLGLTAFVSIAVVPVGILVGNESWRPWTWPSSLFYGSGIVGLISSILIQISYTRLKTAVHNVGDSRNWKDKNIRIVQQSNPAEPAAASVSNEKSSPPAR